jgi:hypothetical protein
MHRSRIYDAQGSWGLEDRPKDLRASDAMMVSEEMQWKILRMMQGLTLRG